MSLKLISFNMHGFQQGCSVVEDLIADSTDDYLAIIRSSKKSATPFIVQECTVHDFEKYVKIRKPRNLLMSKSVVLQYDRHGNVTSHQNYSLMTPDVVCLSHL